MAYLGNNPTTQSFTSGTDYFSGTGSQTAFTLTRTVNSVNDIEVVINNVVQQPSTAYTLSGTTITFTSAPSSGTNNIYVRYLATNMQSFTVPANSITRNQLDSNLQAGFQGRNKIINGSMVVDQRNAGASIGVTDGSYAVDRWKNTSYDGTAQTGKLTSQQNAGSVTPPAGYVNYLGFTSLAATSLGANAEYTVGQNLEGLNVGDLNWGSVDAKTVTLSFWVRSSLTGTFGGSLRNSNVTRSYPFTYTISSANTWEQKTVTVVGDTSGTWLATNAIGFRLIFGLGVGASSSGTAGTWASANYTSATGATSVVGTSGATFYITGVQLEEGTTATSFEREAYSVTLQKCQRYYAKMSAESGAVYTGFGAGFNGSTNTTSTYVKHPVTMRSSPTVSQSSLAISHSAFAVDAVTSIAGSYCGKDSSNLNFTIASTLIVGGASVVLSNGNAAGYLAFSAEL